MAGENHHGKDGGAAFRLKLGIAVSVCFVAVEAAVGIYIGSLSLTSDAAHNAADTLSMVLALVAIMVMARAPTRRRTYGYGRAGVLAALANAMALVAVAGILAYSSIVRMIHVQKVSGPTIMIVAGVGFVLNGLVALILSGHRHELTVKSAFSHTVADAAVSLGVLVAGLVIATTGWYYADPVIALVISAIIIVLAWQVVREAGDILMESVPRHMDLDSVRGTMESIEGVDAVHHLHVWELGHGVYALSGHIEVEDRFLSECSSIMEHINRKLEKEFNIIHPTIQMECGGRCPTV